MAIIDSRGRLFGRINIIDFGILVFVLFVTGVLGYGIYRLNKPKTKPQPQPKTTIEIPVAEYERLKQVNTQVINFLEEHKRAKRYFEFQN